MKKLIIGLALVFGGCSLAIQPAAALDFICPEDATEAECAELAKTVNRTDCLTNTPESSITETTDCITAIVEPSAIDPTFVVETDDDDFFNFKFGNNRLLAGNNFTNDAKTKGLLFSFGNNLNQKSESDYLFLAGNNVTFTGKTNKDIFAAGNNVQFKTTAKVGGDIYVAGNTIVLETNLSGDFSATAAKVVIEDVTIHGNVNLDAEAIAFGDEVTIDGTLVYNDNANITGLDHVKAGEVQTFTPEIDEFEPAAFWLGRFFSACGLFATLLLIVLAFPRTKERITTATSPAHLGGIIISGLGTLVLLPLIAFLLLMTYVATTTGVILLVVFIVLLYVAQAFAGAYFGHLIISKLFRNNKCPLLLEAAIGIALIICLEVVPALTMLVGLIATIFGLGTIVTIIRPRKTIDTYTGGSKNAPQVIAAKTTQSDNPFRTKTSKSTADKTKKSSSKKK